MELGDDGVFQQDVDTLIDNANTYSIGTSGVPMTGGDKEWRAYREEWSYYDKIGTFDSQDWSKGGRQWGNN